MLRGILAQVFGSGCLACGTTRSPRCHCARPHLSYRLPLQALLFAVVGPMQKELNVALTQYAQWAAQQERVQAPPCKRPRCEVAPATAVLQAAAVASEPAAEQSLLFDVFLSGSGGAAVAAPVAEPQVDDDACDGDWPAPPAIDVPTLVAKMREVHAQKKQCVLKDDMPGAAVCKNRLTPLREALAVQPLCRGCFIKYPSKKARELSHEHWLGNPLKKTKFPFCRFCGPGAQNRVTANDWPQDDIQASLERRVAYDVEVAYHILLKHWDKTAPQIVALRKEMRATRVGQGAGKGVRWRGKNAKPVVERVVVGQINRTLTRCAMEIHLQPQRSVLEHVLKMFGAE